MYQIRVHLCPFVVRFSRLFRLFLKPKRSDFDQIVLAPTTLATTRCRAKTTSKLISGLPLSLLGADGVQHRFQPPTDFGIGWIVGDVLVFLGVLAKVEQSDTS